MPIRTEYSSTLSKAVVEMATYIETMTGDVQKVLEALKAQRGEFSLAMLYKEEGIL